MVNAPDSILDLYDLAPPIERFTVPYLGSNNGILGVRAANGEFVLKTYRTHDARPTILYEHDLLNWLARQGLSFDVPVPVLTRSGETLTRTPDGWQALYAGLTGAHPDLDDLYQVESMGAALGELHSVFSAYSIEPRPDIAAFGDLRQLHPNLADPFTLRPGDIGLPDMSPYDESLSWWRDELAGLRPFLDGAYRALPRQVVHRDFDPSNTLVREGRVAAMLDFDFAGPDVRALDVAASLKLTMRAPENEAALNIASAFCKGYARWIRLTPAEVVAVPWLMRLRDVASTVMKLGRALDGGDVRPLMKRIESMRIFTDWLELYEEQFVDVIGQAV